jgi:hypothetical protein
MNQNELDQQNLLELNAKLNGLPILVQSDSKALKVMCDQTQILELQLSNLKAGIDEANSKITRLTELINETYDINEKKNYALDLLIKKLE